MKKLTDKKIAELLNTTPSNILYWKKNKPLQYEAVRGYFLLKENEIFEKLKKLEALASLVMSDCESKYEKELETLIAEVSEVIKEIKN